MQVILAEARDYNLLAKVIYLNQPVLVDNQLSVLLTRRRSSVVAMKAK